MNNIDAGCEYFHNACGLRGCVFNPSEIFILKSRHSVHSKFRSITVQSKLSRRSQRRLKENSLFLKYGLFSQDSVCLRDILWEFRLFAERQMSHRRGDVHQRVLQFHGLLSRESGKMSFDVEIFQYIFRIEIKRFQW